MEIERKWLLNGFPNELKELKEVYIEQGYLSIIPEVRIRKYNDPKLNHTDYKLCIKSDGDLSRTEVETYIELNQYEELKKMINKPMISKIYKKYELENGLVLECSLVDADTKNSFYYAEIEFESEQAANSFILPFDALEVTFDKNYKMKNYWSKTRLKFNYERLLYGLFGKKKI